jgi:hypothetical protein
MEGICGHCFPMGVSGHKFGQLVVSWGGKHVHFWRNVGGKPVLEIPEKTQIQSVIP